MPDRCQPPAESSFAQKSLSNSPQPPALPNEANNANGAPPQASLPDGSAYLRYRIPGFFRGEPDAIEFLVRPTAAEGRDWEGDAAGGLLVLMRSCAGSAQFVYPFMTPVSDGGLQRRRLQQLREALRWRLVGCELVECYT